MKVFLSWSGAKSRQFAEQLREWIPLVIQSVRPYFSPEDIEKGSRWSSEIATELSVSQVGIICVTRDNLHSDWLLFEAGALSKSIDKAHVCPVLFGVGNADIEGPLKQFQTTDVTKQDFLRLLNLINAKLGEHKIAQKILERSFELNWPELEEHVHILLKEEVTVREPIRSDRSILEEILLLSRKAGSATANPAFVSRVALKDALVRFLAVCQQQRESKGGYQETLDLLKTLVNPLTYIAEKATAGRESDELKNLVKTMRSFDFTIHSAAADEDDDEIPF